MTPASVLVVAAHPDDEVLGCGATTARLCREGNKVHHLILGEGVTSRYARPEDADPRLLAVLQANARQAGRILGVEDVSLLTFPDNRFDTVPLLDLVKSVEAAISRVRPGTIYTHSASDLNIDHALVHRAVVTATRPVPGCIVDTVYAFEVPSSTEWAFGAAPFRPNVFVDVGATVDRKIDAMAVYESEMRAFPHPRSPEALRTTARRWGSVAGVTSAEAFELVRELRRARG